MAGVLLGLHILICSALMVVVLLQSGKGGGLAGAFGGAGGVGAVFGGQTAADFLTKATRYLAVAFMVTSLALALVARGRVLGTIEGSLERRAATPAAATGEALPATDLPEALPGSEQQAAPEGEGAGTGATEQAPVQQESGQ
jgi:preprotein translocase subunit SecG